MDSSVVVTGGARGIGRAIAEQLVARGHRVVLTDVDGAAATDTATEIGAVAGLTHDVRNPAEHAAAAEAALDHGPLLAWFNNAGVGDDGRLAEMTEEQVRRLVEVNLLGVVWGMRAALEAFGPGGGDVVNTASLAGLGPVPGYGVYAATKAARRLAHRLGGRRDPAPGAGPRGLPGRRATPRCSTRATPTTRSARGSPTPAVACSTAEQVARQAVSLLGSRRVLLSVPGWRGGVARAAGLAPSLSRHAMRLVEARAGATIARRGR